jgi:hypothetical protein
MSGSKGERSIRRQGLRGAWLIGVAATLLWQVLTVSDLSPAEARTGGVHVGSRASFRHAVNGGFGHQFQGGFRDGLHHRFRGNVFLFNVGVGGFFPGYTVGYPYPAYYPYDYPNYYPYYSSPCGYDDAYEKWINTACPSYAPLVLVPR